MDTKPVDLEAVERRRFRSGFYAVEDVEALVGDVKRLREALAGLVAINAADFPRGSDGRINWNAYPTTFGYANAYRAALSALGEEVFP